MAVRRDYIPGNMAAFHNWFVNLHQYVEKKTAGGGWGHIPGEEIEKLKKAFASWKENYDSSVVSGSVSAPVKRRSARRKAEDVIRPFVKRHLHFEEVSDEERVDMGIPTHEKRRRQSHSVHEEMNCVLITRSPRMVEAHFKVQGLKSKAKPNNYDGAMVAWAVLDAEPKSIGDLSNQTLASRTPFMLMFDEEDRGKKLYIALAWQNARGTLGNWTNILSTYIP